MELLLFRAQVYLKQTIMLETWGGGGEEDQANFECFMGRYWVSEATNFPWSPFPFYFIFPVWDMLRSLYCEHGVSIMLGIYDP